MRILGIDPGSLITGFGIIDVNGNTASYVASGCVRLPGDALPERLRILFEGVRELVTTYEPTQLAIEQIFMHRNADSALKLGQARGAAICAAATLNLPVHEYTPAQIKQAMVGKGNAAKEQVQHMVKVLLKLPAVPQADAADALAVALCHCHTQQVLSHIGGAQSWQRRRLKGAI